MKLMGNEIWFNGDEGKKKGRRKELRKSDFVNWEKMEDEMNAGWEEKGKFILSLTWKMRMLKIWRSDENV